MQLGGAFTPELIGSGGLRHQVHASVYAMRPASEDVTVKGVASSPCGEGL
ncbi:MAG: hypothetical protein QG671_3987 [Actinomycetota bacterium]|jgi:hypothetical protein|nr:hypothetical protein [Actinomycetota bacterium]MDQ5974068.1 hypothetical protein [Actinomycetota bacterium]